MTDTLFFNGVGLLIAVAVIVASFVSKTMVFGRIFGSKSQKMTWFGRTWMFLAGLTGVYEFGLPILKQLHVVINPAWSDVGLRVSKFILETLLLLLVVPFLFASIRVLIRREEPSKINRLISVALVIVWAYLLWNVLPGMAKEISAVFHR